MLVMMETPFFGSHLLTAFPALFFGGCQHPMTSAMGGDMGVSLQAQAGKDFLTSFRADAFNLPIER